MALHADDERRAQGIDSKGYVKMTLDQVTSEMSARVAQKGGIKGKVVKFHFGDQGVVRINGAADPATVDNEDGAADCTVRVSLSDFIDMAQGRLNSMNAFMTGKIRIEGDMGIAMQLGQVLA
jgi:putative sterol carrier protein